MNQDEEVARLRSLLRDAIKLSKRSNREVEKALGLSGGYLSRLFAGVMDLRVEHILAVCAVIGFPPAEFFRAAYPMRDGEDQRGSKLQQALARLHPSTPQQEEAPKPASAESAGAKPNEEEIERMLLSALRKLLTNQSNQA
ncbi:MAG TPA: helix-turn-helix transcriptional regulator [Thermoanaerobaculia bacterium]|nr:helix-turn-helix transcriptional regulator [Thermoanaerobaculia bacterium]